MTTRQKEPRRSVRSGINVESRIGLAEDDLDTIDATIEKETESLQTTIARIERKLDIRFDRITYLVIVILLTIVGTLGTVIFQ